MSPSNIPSTKQSAMPRSFSHFLDNLLRRKHLLEITALHHLFHRNAFFARSTSPQPASQFCEANSLHNSFYRNTSSAKRRHEQRPHFIEASTTGYFKPFSEAFEAIPSTTCFGRRPFSQCILGLCHKFMTTVRVLHNSTSASV